MRGRRRRRRREDDGPSIETQVFLISLNASVFSCDCPCLEIKRPVFIIIYHHYHPSHRCFNDHFVSLLLYQMILIWILLLLLVLLPLTVFSSPARSPMKSHCPQSSESSSSWPLCTRSRIIIKKASTERVENQIISYTNVFSACLNTACSSYSSLLLPFKPFISATICCHRPWPGQSEPHSEWTLPTSVRPSSAHEANLLRCSQPPPPPPLYLDSTSTGSFTFLFISSFRSSFSRFLIHHHHLLTSQQKIKDTFNSRWRHPGRLSIIRPNHVSNYPVHFKSSAKWQISTSQSPSSSESFKLRTKKSSLPHFHSAAPLIRHVWA